jgi:hypothetical protein
MKEKGEQEEQEMQAKVRQEVEARIKMEEEVKKIQRTIQIISTEPSPSS